MHRIAAVAKNPALVTACRRVALAKGFSYDEEQPELVVTLGGDGTLLFGERRFPGVPKLPLRASKTCQKCFTHTLEDALDAVLAGDVSEETLQKLAVTLGGERRLAMNDVIFRNRSVERAVRFSLLVDEEELFHELIGDGLVIATPFGSSAYFQSITRETFTTGIGVALNNTTRFVPPLLLDDSCVVTVRVLRGPALLAADNHPFSHILVAGDTFRVRAAPERARLLHLHPLRT